MLYVCWSVGHSTSLSGKGWSCRNIPRVPGIFRVCFLKYFEFGSQEDIGIKDGHELVIVAAKVVETIVATVIVTVEVV